jgi:hypothetical protein
MKIWCPYIDEEIDEAVATLDHIISLSFGGCNTLQIPTSSRQWDFGSKVEGKLAKDFFLAQYRIAADARGHRKKSPRYDLRNAREIGSDKPLRVAFSPGSMVAYDPRTRRPVERPTNINFQIEIDRARFIHLRAQLLAKIALSIGYKTFSDAYRSHVAHDQLRRVLMSTSLTDFRDDREFPATLDLSIFGSGRDNPMMVAIAGLCKSIGRHSCIGIVPGEGRLKIFVGLLGSYLGQIACDCNIDALWSEPDNRYGKFLFIKDRRVIRMGLREAFERVLYAANHPDAWTVATPPGLKFFIDNIRPYGCADR